MYEIIRTFDAAGAVFVVVSVILGKESISLCVNGISDRGHNDAGVGKTLERTG